MYHSLKAFSALITAIIFLVPSAARAGEEQDLIATLRSDANAAAKCTACLRLRIVGTTNAVPALVSLLGDDRTAHAARNALEGLPFPEAAAALRQACGTASGSLKAGLVDSLGWRHDNASVPLLISLLSDPNHDIASAAATALGRIGGKEAVAALMKARDQAAPPVQPSLLNGLLECAGFLQKAGDTIGAASVYRNLLSAKEPESIIVAAWRGLVIADSSQRVKLVLEALAGNSLPLRAAALKTLRELNDAALFSACLAQWSSLPAEAQLAFVETCSGRAGSPGSPSAAQQLETLNNATRSSDLAVRIAAWTALGNVGGGEAIPALLGAAASAREPAERDAAREALSWLRGKGVSEDFINRLATIGPPEKAELIRAIGERGDRTAAAALLQQAAMGPETVRLAALESLRKIATPENLLPVLNLAARSGPETDPQPALRTLYAICQAIPDKEETTRQVLAAMNAFDAKQRGRVMPLLAELGTTAALNAVLAATRVNDPETVREAVRVLAQWPNTAPVPALLLLARSSTDKSIRILALRGCLEAAALEPDHSRRLALLGEARSVAQRPDEKKQALGKISQIPTPEALQVAVADLADPELASEAGLAAITIAEQLAATKPVLASETAIKVLAQCKNPDIVKRAWALRGKPTGAAPFIQDWLVSGPYHQPGATGAMAVFEIAFAPEKPGETAAWKPAPRSEHMNLLALFPDEANCAAYLRTRVTAEQDCEGVLLMGSDDGVKAWLNGAVVHSNNIDRGDLADQDMAPIRLRKGANELMLKITQGGGGWSARARITGADGQPISGLQFSSPQP